MLATRPDLAYPVGMLAHHASNSSPAHEDTLIHLAGYLSHTKQICLVYKKSSVDQTPGLMEAYTNADWAGEQHSARSTSGMIILKNDLAICWGSKRQGIVSRSTMESEYIALYTTANHLDLMIKLKQQLRLTVFKPTIWCNNKAAIAIATGSVMDFKRTRFMNIKYHWVRKAYEGLYFNIEYVKSEHNLADMFTKRLAPNPLRFLRDLFLENHAKKDELEEYEASGDEEDV